jgi:hypothetical protein
MQFLVDSRAGSNSANSSTNSPWASGNQQMLLQIYYPLQCALITIRELVFALVDSVQNFEACQKVHLKALGSKHNWSNPLQNWYRFILGGIHFALENASLVAATDWRCQPMAFLGGPFAQLHGTLVVKYGGVAEFVAECFHMGLFWMGAIKLLFCAQNPVPFWLIHNIRLDDRVNGTTVNIQLKIIAKCSF